MRLLSLDYDPVYGDETVRAKFASDISVFDFDVVFWDPEPSLDSYLTTYPPQYRGLPSLNEHTSVRIQADVERRREEFAKFVSSGRVLVVFVRPEQICYIDTGEREYSGTGRNRQETRLVRRFDLLSALPIENYGFSRASGRRVSFVGDNPIVSVLRKYRDYLSYEAVMTQTLGTPLAKVAGTELVVASMLKCSNNGHIIFLPSVDFLADVSDEDEDESEGEGESDDNNPWLPISADFQADLLSAIAALDAKDMSRPAWAARFATEEQELLRVEIVEQQKRVEEARAKLFELQQKKEALDARDQLYLGTGRALELEVKAVFELLGAVVTEPEPGRTDWKVEFPEGDAVVEVKGVSKSAAERHAAQLEKWVASALEESGVSPKGILVVNTWRDKPLDERTEEDFPSQMLTYAVRRGHCLVTGLQLFIMRSEIEKDPSRAEYWRKKILETSGVLNGCNDWRSVIREISTEADV